MPPMRSFQALIGNVSNGVFQGVDISQDLFILNNKHIFHELQITCNPKALSTLHLTLAHQSKALSLVNNK